MLTKEEKDLLTDYLDEYIDDLRIEAKFIDGSRTITEESKSRVVVVDRNFIIDDYSEYEVLLRNPVEPDFFIPKTLHYYVTRFELHVDRANGFEVIDILDEGASDIEIISIDDPRISDDGLRNLLNHMCFDERYQKLFPEVTVAIKLFLSNKDNAEDEKLKARIGPFFCISDL